MRKTSSDSMEVALIKTLFRIEYLETLVLLKRKFLKGFQNTCEPSKSPCTAMIC